MTWTWIPLVAALAGCGTAPTGPGPGATPPGKACGTAADCGCWQCTCKGIDGPGQGQLCLDGHCPSGTDACQTVCATADAGVASAVAIDRCP